MTGRRKHPVWIHFNEENTEGKTKRAICKYCKLSIVALVERMIKHKITCCPMSENGMVDQKPNVNGFAEDKNKTNIAGPCIGTYVIKPTDSNVKKVNKTQNASLPYPLKHERITNVEKEMLDEQIVKMILATNSPLEIVEHPEFKTIFKMLRPEYKIPNRYTIANELLFKTYSKLSQNVIHALNGKPVCILIDGWSNIHNDSTICISVYNIEDQILHPIDTFDTKNQPHTTQYLCNLVAKSICKCNAYNFKVTSLVSNSLPNMREMREHLAKHPDLRGLDILTYNCSSHMLNLLSIDLQIPGAVEHLKAVIEYFKSTDFVQEKYKTAGGKDLSLPVELRCDMLVDMFESYIQNWHIMTEVCNKNITDIDSIIINKLNDVQMKNIAIGYLERLKIISMAFVKSQKDTCTIGEMTEIWLDLINKFKNDDDDVKIKIIKRFEMSTTPVHYLANILDPRFEGKKLKRCLLDKALEYAESNHPTIIPDIIEYQAHSGPYKDYLFTTAFKINRDLKPVVWWKSLEKTKHKQISEHMFMLNKQLHSAIASSSRSEGQFSYNGFMHNKQADAENQQFQWNHTSEDSYAEANEASVSGYEADSVLASIMHESMDDYHNQEPIVDVQERQTWACRRYRDMLQGAGGDYSDDDGGGTYGNSRKIMRMSRPDGLVDEFSTFSDYVAERMRNLKADKALQLMARRDIEQVLFKYEMKLLEKKKDSQQQQQQQPDTEAATTSKSISPSPVSDLEQQ